MSEARQLALVRHLGDACRADERVTALFLAGSLGNQTADPYSDVDFLAVVDAAHRAAFADDWLARVERFEHVVFTNRQAGALVLVNVITSSWLRCDVVVGGEEGLVGRSQRSLQVVLDRQGLIARLPLDLPPLAPNRERVRGLINEFIRVLGLLAVVIGRHEYAVGATGAGLLRSHLISLLTEEVEVPDRGGVLHLNRLLSPERRALLESLPAARADRESVIQAHVALANAFLPLARQIAARLDLPWPEDFESATRHYLSRELGVQLSPVNLPPSKQTSAGG